MRCLNILVAGLLLLLASCGASPHNLVPLPAVKPLAQVTQTPLGPVSVGTAKVLPTTFSKANVSVVPFMGANSTAHPAKEDALPGRKFVIVAFEQPPVLKKPVLKKPVLVVASAPQPTQTRWYCRNYVPQDGKYFDETRAFVPVADEKKEFLIYANPSNAFPFAFAFQVPENSTGGTIVLQDVLYSIQW